MKSTLFAGAVVMLAALGFNGTARANMPCQADEDVVLKNVEIRAGVTDDIHLHIRENPHANCKPRAVLAIHGALGTATVFEPMADAIFASQPHSAQPCKFISMDLPGHGQSSLPHGALLGDLSLEDYASAVIGTLFRLEWRGIQVKELVGHSMGGLVTELVQQKLVDHGTSLRGAFGIKRVVLLAPAMPSALPCAFCESPASAALFGPYMGYDPVYGARLIAPDEVLRTMAWSRPDGSLAANAVTAEEIHKKGYNSPESLAALGQLTGAGPTGRVDVDPGIFAKCFHTKLEMVTFENDTIVRPDEGAALDQYLTADDDLSRFTVLAGDNAVHGLPISDPVDVLDGLDELED